MTYFADTHSFLALLNPNDRAFAKAQQLSLGDRELLVTTEWILMELADGLSTARNRTVFLTLYQRLQIRPNVQIVAADHALFQRAVNFFERRQDKNCRSRTARLS